ncbi:patatin-like phospholipase family protein [Ornithinimicrobium cerasi]|uniref:NTE family protein n=1 Tax=Ornithinimicrobium cerasi TaxID=2248773 RepID=A0A285VIP5_9MICO|nr:patatin-like phospholipase family protein [Ornithinimicrobium cerasi]SOC52421.1 NTE family protein [Ornithinimicrobium cerasi]
MLHHGPGHPPSASADLASAQLEAARATAHHGPSARRPRSGTALCLSGGGFRAALFHLGAVRRLDELGILGRLRTISAVSGGSVVANLLAHPDLVWPDPLGAPARVGGIEELVAEPLRLLTGRNVRTPAMLARLRPHAWGRPDVTSRVLADELERTVPWWGTDLREHRRGGPVILTGATETGYGVSWVFADARSVAPRGRVGDHRLGYAAPPPGLRIVDAVAASCAHPPWFAPFSLDGRTLGLTGGVPDLDEAPEVRASILRRVELADGGLYDNYGLEQVWSDHATVLVSDGGAVFRGRATSSPVGRLWQLLSIAANGAQTTRLRWLRASFSAGLLDGATWSLETPNTVSAVPGHGPEAGLAGCYPAALVSAINRVRTDLDAFAPGEQMVLERHGYVVSDASVRRHSPASVALEAPVDPPHPQVSDEARAADLLAGSERITALGRR